MVFFVSHYFFCICIVHGDSMAPTLHDKEMILMKRFSLQIDYHDVVLIQKNKRTIIKRVVGMPNDRIEINDGIYVNNQKIDNSSFSRGLPKKVLLLKEDEYFVLGDNREHSIDSRSQEINIITKKEIVGKQVKLK